VKDDNPRLNVREVETSRQPRPVVIDSRLEIPLDARLLEGGALIFAAGHAAGKMADLATRAGVEDESRLAIHAPLMKLSKGEIIKKGLELGVNYSLTHSCYDPQPLGAACGQCDSCLLRRKGFAEAGLVDPIDYVA
jgi:hypothetical protein